MATLTLQQMVNELMGSCKLKSTNQYVNYIWQLDKANNQNTANWINSAIQGKKLQDPTGYAMNIFDTWSRTYTGHSIKTISNWKSAYKQLATSVLGIFYANIWAFSNNSSKIDEVLCQIVAQNALFASEDIVKDVINGNQGTNENRNNNGNKYASWDYMSTVRDMKNKGKIITVRAGGNTYKCRADDNTYANRYIKQAVSISKNIKGRISKTFVDYEACHVWDIPGDPRYYASIANLVLLPRAFGQLSDHCPAVKALLRYEVYHRFGFLPTGKQVPTRPTFYGQIKWRK
jgi:hypothetical protein